MIDFMESQYWDFHILESYQIDRLYDIMKYAYDKIPGYKKLWDKHGVHPNQISSIEDLDKFPTVTREMMYNIDEWSNPEFIKTKLHTGGSTGDPLTYYECKTGINYRAQAHRRGWLWSEYNPDKDRRVNLMSLRGKTGKKGLTLNINGNPENSNLKEVLDQVKSFNPKQIRGYVSSIYIVAKWILENNYKINIPSINLIAEQIYDEHRNIIETAFNSIAYSEYVCCDGGASGWSLDDSNTLYQTMERAIIRQDPKTHAMRVTDLINKATVFINYMNGDFFEYLNPKIYDKRNLLPFIVKGRDNDIITLPDGNSVSPSFLLHHASHVKLNGKFIDFKAIQYVQKTRDLMIISVIKGKSYSKDDEDLLIKTVSEICKGLKVKVEYPDILEKSISGKLKFIINETL